MVVVEAGCMVRVVVVSKHSACVRLVVRGRMMVLVVARTRGNRVCRGHGCRCRSMVMGGSHGGRLIVVSRNGGARACSLVRVPSRLVLPGGLVVPVQDTQGVVDTAMVGGCGGRQSSVSCRHPTGSANPSATLI